MSYFRNFLLIFLVVFFIDRVAPGVEISSFEQVPNIGADIFFSAIVGFLNASVFPFYAIFEIKVTKLKIAIATFIISFGAFLLIAIIPFGVRVVSAWGVIIGGLVVWAVAFVGNYLEWQRDTKGS
ncbi:MAG TPA: phage holin family protein [Chlamydiales bacterium]|nr:phage holin family protein [Chlamydiales bacterium]